LLSLLWGKISQPLYPFEAAHFVGLGIRRIACEV
jgi:hypothetical protein